MNWDTFLVPYGKEITTAVHALNFAARSAMTFGGIEPGDMKAAKANNALFFPINPGNEEASWQRLYEEGFDKFVNGEYAGQYEAKLIAEFDAHLPEKPPWMK